MTRHLQQTVALQTAVASAAASGDPDELFDVLDGARLAGNADAVRAVAPVVVGRLSALVDAKVPRAADRYAAASALFASWKPAGAQ